MFDANLIYTAFNNYLFNTEVRRGILAGPVVFFKVHMIKNGKQRWREGAQHFG